jgi:hypothetical protein
MRNKLALLFSASVLLISSTAALADPDPYTFDIRCPNAKTSSDLLSNYGGFIAGYGTKRINDKDETKIYFKSITSIKNIPAQIDHYENAGVKYNSTNGEITCTYSTSLNDPNFAITYTLTNGIGGKADLVSNDMIRIFIPFGKKA